MNANEVETTVAVWTGGPIPGVSPKAEAILEAIGAKRTPFHNPTAFPAVGNNYEQIRFTIDKEGTYSVPDECLIYLKTSAGMLLYDVDFEKLRTPE